MTTATTASNTILLWVCLLMISAPPPFLVSAMVAPSSPSSPSPSPSPSPSSSLKSLKIRVCQGSSCLGKCRGAFNPLTSFENLLDTTSQGDAVESEGTDVATTATATSIELEETFCMNQCKRGPNVRMINADTGNVVTFGSDIMNEVESNRKAFQGITNEARVNRLWGIANQVVDGSMDAIEKGSADKLNDIMPRK